MKYAFTKLRLEAPALHPLITTWAEMKLTVTEANALITGFGFASDIADALTTLAPGWEATIFLPRATVPLKPGEYNLDLIGKDLYAFRGQLKQAVPDGPVVVEVSTGK